jgi:hypothetical protein
MYERGLTESWAGRGKIKIPYLDGSGFILKRPEQLHPEPVHWWLLVHSS